MSSRSRTRPNANPVSLFPFLAVLICTMGTLILLLIIITKLAKSQQDLDVQISDKSQQVQEMEYETAMAESMTSDLLESKKSTELKIEEERAKMAILEKQIEKLANEIDRTLTFLEQREKNQTDQNQEVEKLQKQLAQKQSELATLNEEYRQLQEDHTSSKRSYAIVPYRGPNGTFKRPIYIECTYDKVILQPEGIIFSEMDFVLAGHPDNPLDAGIRAVYQYYLERGLVETGSEPYPLILVRPQGIDAYYAVRTAISSWNDNFGYELVEGDWKLEFPEANPELKKMIANRVEIARMRLQPVFESLVAQEMRMQGLDRPNLARDGMGTGHSNSYGNGRNTGTAGLAGSGTGRGRDMSGATSSGMTGNMPGDSLGSDATGLTAYQNGYGMGSGNATGQATGNGSDFSIAAQQGQYASRENHGGQLNGQLSGQVPGQSSSPSQGNTSGLSGEASSMNDLFIRTEQNGSGEGAGRITMEQIWGSPQNNTQNAPGSPAYTENFDSPQRRPFQPFYEPEPTQNRNITNNLWSLPRPGMTPIGRNIPLLCYPDKLVFVRSAGKGIEQEIMGAPSTHGVSQEFVDAVWKYIETWDDAGNNMYWRPTLKVTVRPGAEAQFEELKTMLNGSGLKVERTP